MENKDKDISHYTKVYREPRLMAMNLQGSSHRPRAVGFRLRNRKNFIYETARTSLSGFSLLSTL